MDIKNILKEEIFKEENGEYLIDLYLDGKKQKSEFSNETIKFLESKKDDLIKEHTKEYAFEKKFFKKYGYENIIENYVSSLIQKNKSLNNSNLKIKQNKININEISETTFNKKMKMSAKEKNRHKKIKNNNYINPNKWRFLKWNKTIKKNNNKMCMYYNSLNYQEGRIEVILYNIYCNKNKIYYLNFDKEDIIGKNYRVYAINANLSIDILKIIENTNPINKCLTMAIEYGLEPKLVDSIINKTQNKCVYHNGDICSCRDVSFCICSVLHENCIYYSEFLNELSKEKCSKENIDKNIKLIKSIKLAKKNQENKKTEVQKLPNKKINIKDFVVRMNIFKCIHKEHKIIDIVAEVNVINTENKIQSIKISAGYCQQCETYFIMESIYKHLKNKGIILCRISDEKSYIRSISENGMDLAKESILMQYGYNVSATEGLSAKRRQRILSVIIDNKIMSKNEIINYIDFFIRQRNNRSNMELAISKWEADREFVENYRIGEFTKFEVNSICRK